MAGTRVVSLVLAVVLTAACAAAQQSSLDQQLLSAALLKPAEDVRRLLDAGANIEAKGVAGQTPLMVAAQSGKQLEVARLLLERHANIEAKNEYLMTPLIQAAQSGNLEVARLLLERHANIEAKSNFGTALNVTSSPELVKLLLDNHADIEARNNEGMTPLAAASRSGRPSIVRVLLEHHANIEAKDGNGNTPLTAASFAKTTLPMQRDLFHYTEVVKILLTNHANVEGQGSYVTPLMAAALQGNVDVLNLLLENGANPSATTRDGKTALILATEKGRCDSVSVLDPRPQTDLASCFKNLLHKCQEFPDSEECKLPSVISSALAAKPPPAIPEDARRAMVQANATFKQAQNRDAYAQAAGLYQQAVKAAPWWGDAWLNFSKAQEKLEKYNDAVFSLKTFLQCSPQDPEARAAQDHIYELELNRGNQDKAVLRAQLAQQRQQIVEAFRGNWYGKTCDEGRELEFRGCNQKGHDGRNWRTFRGPSGPMVLPFEVQNDGTVKMNTFSSWGHCRGDVFGIPQGPSLSDIRWEERPKDGALRQIYSETSQDGKFIEISCDRPLSGASADVGYRYVQWTRTP